MPDCAAAFRWVKANLFAGPVNTLLTLLAVWLLVISVPPLVDWVFASAVWGGGSDACRAAEGACWAFVQQKYRLILFGTYPFAEQWRPLAAMLLFLAAIGLSGYKLFWRRWLAGLWLAVLAAMGVLLIGGVFGLTPVLPSQWGGLTLTLILAVTGCVAALPLAILLALGRRSDMPVISWLATGLIELVRGVPLVTLLFMAAFMAPLFLPGDVSIDQLWRAQVAIILFVAAYLAEIVRGGLQSLPRGQEEAADALGLGYWQKTGLIILPQALRISIPPIVNQFIATFKDTSLVAIIGLIDLMRATRTALADADWRAYFVEAYVFAALIYFLFCFAMSRYSRWLEGELNPERRA